MGLDDSIKLSEAPALFFANAWSRIVSLKDGEEKALQALDHPDPAISVFYRRQFLEANRNDSERRRAASAKDRGGRGSWKGKRRRRFRGRLRKQGVRQKAISEIDVASCCGLLTCAVAFASER